MNFDRAEQKLDRFVRFLDKLSEVAEKVPNILLKGGVAYAGYRAANHPLGMVTGLVGLELAKSPGLVASAAGTTTLAMIGLGNATQSEPQFQTVDPAEQNIFLRALRNALESASPIGAPILFP